MQFRNVAAAAAAAPETPRAARSETRANNDGDDVS